jgi:hypothetical protein
MIREWRINNYNKRSAKKLGWDPTWLDPILQEFDKYLIARIKLFQAEHSLSSDGMVGPQTFRRLLSQRDLDDSVSHGFLLVDGVKLKINWDVKLNILPSNCYKKSRSTRKPKMIVTHWDATTSADKCKRVLQARKISSHFCIDNDGVIHQYVDTNHIAWHAGGVNKISIGIDFSNAYYTKYNKWYQANNFGKRPVLDASRVHGRKLKPHLGYYDVQITAYKALLKALSDHYDIPLQCPTENGRLVSKVYEAAAKKKYEGVVCHYHLTRNKIDCAGLELDKILEEIK